MPFQHNVWVVSEGMPGYLPNSVVAFETELEARDFLESEINFWNSLDEDSRFEEYNKNDHIFNSLDNDEQFTVYPQIIVSDYADIDEALEDYNNW